MTDSETTRRQKRLEFGELVVMIQYLETHGLDCITLGDLRAAVRALENMDMSVNR